MKKLKLSIGGIIIVPIVALFALGMLISGSIMYVMFRIKCIFYPKQLKAFEELASTAHKELSRLKQLSIAELRSLPDSTKELSICGRNGWLSIEKYEKDNTFIIIRYSIKFFNWDSSIYEINAIGFRIDEHDNKIDMSLLEVDEIINL